MAGAEWHEVLAGEDMVTIAALWGFADWESVWNDEVNIAEREASPERPWDPFVLEPGMRIWIPEHEEGADSGQTDQTHEFVVPSPGRRLRLRIMDGEEPMANAQYLLEIDGAAPISGTTTGAGYIDLEIPEWAAKARLEVGLMKIDLAIGQLDPVTSPKGIQARLNNLGFVCGAVDGIVGPATRGAVRLFQRSTGGQLAADGIAGKFTQAALADRHGI